MITMEESDEEMRRHSAGLYTALGLVVNRTVAFHLTVEGKVTGAIELINPVRAKIDAPARQVLCSLVSLFFQAETV
jgi:hypothetical protein